MKAIKTISEPQLLTAAKAAIDTATACEVDYGYMKLETPSGMAMLLFSIVGDVAVLTADDVYQCDASDVASIERELRMYAAENRRFTPSLLKLNLSLN